MSSGLLLVDIQNDYFPGGNMELVGMDAAAGEAAKLLATFRGAGRPVFHVQHLSVHPGATFFLPDTAGVEIHQTVKPEGDEALIQKNFPNAFHKTQLLETIRDAGAEQLVICGAMSHMCIDATTRAAFELGFQCTLAEDACATRDLAFKGENVAAKDVHAAFMAALSAPYAKVTSADECLSSL